MLPKDMIEGFELGRKWWKELEQQIEVGPDAQRFQLSQRTGLAIAMIRILL